ncbi:hypothetical protein GGI25_004176 [Coemansia spiralis]|uniref:Uncharacterized protein n=1 Tax=Coemansia spiralis TaxID=417178 RepID=A0A9W8G5P0_9FUNG|nr:hypothetical protein GGI25_004176 [Coemansia spiralis]
MQKPTANNKLGFCLLLVIGIFRTLAYYNAVPHCQNTVQSTDDPTKENDDLEARRRAICKVVREHLDESTYYVKNIVDGRLELKDEYSAFKSAVGDKFEGLVDEIMDSTHDEEHPAISRGSRNKVEREKADYFGELFLKMRDFAARSIDDIRYNKTQYEHIDKQDTPVSGTNIKPDGLFCFSFTDVSFETTHIILEVKPTEFSKHIPDKTLGQIGDYVLSVWNEQPLRTFVPVLMLHGQRLDLLLFTRSKVLKVMVTRQKPKGQLGGQDLWIPTDRFSECTAYSTLRKNGVTGVPEVLYYGTLKADFFGYRMEILLLEDCGTPIIDHLDNISTPQNFMKCANKLAKCAKEAASTLVHAYDAADDVDIDMPNILQNEDEHGRFTGTPLYMSIQILRGFNIRGVTHDIKSLFMIVLHTLAVLNKSAEVTDDAKYGWKFLGSEIMAILRIGFFACSNTYLEKLGCPKLTVGLKKVVKSMYRFLFQDKDGIYIGGKLGNRLDYERGFKLGAAGGFLDDEVLAKLQFIQQNYAMQEMEVDMSSALPVPMPQAMQSKQIKLQAEASAPRASAARTLAPVAAAVPASYARARTLVVRTNVIEQKVYKMAGQYGGTDSASGH